MPKSWVQFPGNVETENRKHKCKSQCNYCNH